MGEWLSANWPGIWKWLTEGNAPDWATGVVALFALIYAKRAAIAAIRTYQVQAKQVRDLEQDRRCEQADLFSAWSRAYAKGYYYKRPLTSPPERVMVPDIHQVAYEVRNDSKLNVQDVTIYVEGEPSTSSPTCTPCRPMWMSGVEAVAPSPRRGSGYRSDWAPSSSTHNGNTGTGNQGDDWWR